MTTLIIIFAICAFGGAILYEAIRRVKEREAGPIIEIEISCMLESEDPDALRS